MKDSSVHFSSAPMPVAGIANARSSSTTTADLQLSQSNGVAGHGTTRISRHEALNDILEEAMAIVNETEGLIRECRRHPASSHQEDEGTSPPEERKRAPQ